MGAEFSWEILPPTRTARMGEPKPKASVRMICDEGEVEYLPIPAAVSRTLAKRKKANEIRCSSKHELMETVRLLTEQVAKERVAQLIARRDYASREVYNKLVMDGFTKAESNDALAYAKGIGLVSDSRFADSFVRGKVFAGWGMERIARELARRGIDVDSLDGWPYDYLDPEEERTRAMEVALRKRVREPNAYAKLVRFLVGRGFSYGVATSVAREVLDERGVL